MRFLVYVKNNELGDYPRNPQRTFKTLTAAKKYLNTQYTSLGEAIFEEGNFKSDTLFSRKLSVADTLAVITEY